MTDKSIINVGDVCAYSYDNENKSLCIVKIKAQASENVFVVEFLQVIVDDTGNDFFTYLKDKSKTMNVSRKYLHKINIVDIQQAEIEKLKQVKSQLEKDIFNEHMNYEAVKEELDEIEKEHKYLKKELDKYDPFYFCSFGGCEGVSNTCWKDCADSVYNVTRSDAVKEFTKLLIDKTNGGKISSTDILDFMVVYLKETEGEE